MTSMPAPALATFTTPLNFDTFSLRLEQEGVNFQ